MYNKVKVWLDGLVFVFCIFLYGYEIYVFNVINFYNIISREKVEKKFRFWFLLLLFLVLDYFYIK